MPKQSSESDGKINIDRLFNAATTATFFIQLLAIIVLIGASVGYVFVFTGIWNWLQNYPDIIVFLLLIGGAIAFVIFMVFFGFFTRFHKRVKGFVLGEGIGRISASSREAQIILTLFAFSVVFFFIAGLYGIYLLWKYILIPIFFASTNSIYPPLILATFAVVVVCLMVQGAAAGVSRYAKGIVQSLTEIDEK